MSILKSEIDLQGSKPRYLRTTKNLYSHMVNGRELFFSYQTLVAIDDLISVNDWSNTTARHLYWINPNKEIRVEDFEQQARKILKDDDLISCDDQLKTVSNISRIFALMSESETEESIRKTNNQRKRFYETINGISFPSDWDSLDTATQKRRLDICDYVNTDKAKEYIEGGEIMPMSKDSKKYILEVYENRLEESKQGECYNFSIDLAVGKLEIFADWVSGENELDYDYFINKTDYHDGGRFMREAFEQPEDYQFEFLVFDILESYFTEDCIYRNESLYKQLRK